MAVLAGCVHRGRAVPGLEESLHLRRGDKGRSVLGRGRERAWGAWRAAAHRGELVAARRGDLRGLGTGRHLEIHRRRLHLGFGRIVTLAKEAPNLFVNLVKSSTVDERYCNATMQPGPICTVPRSAIRARQNSDSQRCSTSSRATCAAHGREHAAPHATSYRP